MAMVYTLKLNEIIRVGGRRIGLSWARPSPSVPSIRPPGNNGTTIGPESNGALVPPEPTKGPVFLIIELQQGEACRIGDLRLLWDTSVKSHKGRVPSLIIDGQKAKYPVEKSEDGHTLDRSQIQGVVG